MALARAILLVARGDYPFDPALQAAALSVVTVIGLWSAWIVWRWTRQTASASTMGGRRGPQLTAGILALLALFLPLPIAAAASANPRLLIGNATLSSLAVVLIGIAASSLTMRQRHRRLTASILALGAFAAGVVSVIDDLPTAPALQWKEGTLAEVARIPIGSSAFQLELSPGGTRFAARRSGTRDADDELTAARYVVGALRTGAPRRTVTASELRFIDEERVLLLQPRTNGIEVRLERIDSLDGGSPILWQQTLPAMGSAQTVLTLDRARGAWIVAGPSDDENALLIASGTVGTNAVVTTKRRVDSLPKPPIFAFDDRTLLVAAPVMPTAGVASPGHLALASFIVALNAGGVRWDLSRVDERGSHPVLQIAGYPTCTPGANRDAALCLEQRAGMTRLWNVHRTGEPTPIARLGRRYDRVRVTADGIAVASSYAGRSIAMLAPEKATALTATLPNDGTRYIADVVGAPGMVATLGVASSGSLITLYRIAPK
jgi:hypothetical protein